MANLFTAQNILFIPVFLIIISVLVAAHEYGHYLFAKIFKMGVEEFSIGMFGKKPLLTYGRKDYTIPLLPGQVPNIALPEHVCAAGEVVALEGKPNKSEVVETPEGTILKESTFFTVRPWPVGGFVRIKGMIPEEDGSETKIAGGFYSKPPWQRLIVLVAGPVFSVIAGVILLFLVFVTAGEPKDDLRPILGIVTGGSPAEKAGLKVGDHIVSVAGAPVNTFFDIITHVRNSPNKQVPIVYVRGDKQLTTTVVPVPDTSETDVLNSEMMPSGKKAIQGKIGLGVGTKYVPISVGHAAIEAIKFPAKAVVMMGGLFAKPAELKDNVGGPISMLKQTRSALDQGLPSVIGFAAILSISVGILNLLPIPPLDGGQMVIAFAEMFRRGRRLSMKVQNMAVMAGMCLVCLLIIFVFTIDLQRIGKSDIPQFSDRNHGKAPAKAPSKP